MRDFVKERSRNQARWDTARPPRACERSHILDVVEDDLGLTELGRALVPDDVIPIVWTIRILRPSGTRPSACARPAARVTRCSRAGGLPGVASPRRWRAPGSDPACRNTRTRWSPPRDRTEGRRIAAPRCRDPRARRATRSAAGCEACARRPLLPTAAGFVTPRLDADSIAHVFPVGHNVRLSMRIPNVERQLDDVRMTRSCPRSRPQSDGR